MGHRPIRVLLADLHVHIALLILLTCPAGLALAGPLGSTRTELAGNSLTSFPYFEYQRAFNQDSQDPAIEIGIDPTRFAQIRGETCSIYVVQAKLDGEWIAGPTLSDVRGSAQAHTFPSAGGIQTAGFRVTLTGAPLSADAAPCYGSTCIGVGHAYDVVLDCDQNGTLGAGDFIDGGGDEAGLYVVHDTTQQKLSVQCADVTYDEGDPLSGFEGQRTYVPANFEQIASCSAGVCQNPLPLIVISHGAGHQYHYYDYLQKHLASYGYVVMSHQNDANVGIFEPSTTTLLHTDFLLDLLDPASQSPPCAARIQTSSACESEAQFNLCQLIGRVDTSHIVWIGHSRGALGVVYAYNRLGFDDSNPHYFDAEHFGQEDIALISSIAPLDVPFESDIPRLARAETVPYSLMWTSGDWEISGVPTFQNKSNQAFGLLERAIGPRQSVYIHGGAHGWFHEHCPASPSPLNVDCISRGPTDDTQEDVHQIAKGYYTALLAGYLRHSVAAQDFFNGRPWKGTCGQPPCVQSWPAWLRQGIEVAAEHRFIDPNSFVIDDYESNFSTSVSSSGKAVNKDLAPEPVDPVEGEMEDQDCHFDWNNTTTSSGFEDDIAPLAVFCNGSGGCSCTNPPVLPGSGPPNDQSQTRCSPFFDCPAFTWQQPMNGLTRSREGGVSRGVVLGWQEGSFYEWSIDPSGIDFSKTTHLSFRVAQMPRHPNTLAEINDLDFKVTLRDTDGDSKSVNLSSYGAGIIEPFQRMGPFPGESVIAEQQPMACFWVPNQECCYPSGCDALMSDPGWQAEFETVRIRLADFLTDGSAVDLNKLAAVRFQFGGTSGSAQGRIAIDDVELTSVGLFHRCPSVSPCNEVAGCLRGAELSDIDTGFPTCQPSTGAPTVCASDTVHVVTNSCVKAACCSQEPACACQVENCPNGSYLECR